jgi:hypothetical protein
MILSIFDGPGTDTPITDNWEHRLCPHGFRPVTLCRQLERMATEADAARIEAEIEAHDLRRKLAQLQSGVWLDRAPRVIESLKDLFPLAS